MNLDRVLRKHTLPATQGKCSIHVCSSGVPSVTHHLTNIKFNIGTIIPGSYSGHDQNTVITGEVLRSVGEVRTSLELATKVYGVRIVQST